MGFNLKTWVNRISEYPTRRKLTKSDGSTELVTVERAEGQVSQEGNAFSADEMNDLEKRISEGFDELNSDLDDKLSTSGGEILQALQTAGTAIRNRVTTGSTNFLGGTNFSDGANLILRGKDQENINGRFELSANDGTSSATLIGNPNGTLYFNNHLVVLNGSDHVDLATSQGKVQIACNSEGGNVRLTKITSDGLDPHIEIDTCMMNGKDGSARLYIGNSNSEAYTGFNFCEDGSFQDGNGVNTGGLAAGVTNAVNAVNSLAGAVSGLQVYFDDTNAGDVTDLLRKKCILALSKFSGSEGVCINYGGWSGVDFGLFIGQVKGNEVKGIYTASHNAYRISYNGNTSIITYAEITCGSEISSS